MFSSPVRSMPAGRTRFCASSAWISWLGWKPKPASVAVSNSMKTVSSWMPKSSICSTSGTKSSSERIASTLSRSSRIEKPSAVKP